MISREQMAEAALAAWTGSENFTYDNEGQLATGHGAGYAFDYEHRLTGVKGRNGGRAKLTS